MSLRIANLVVGKENHTAATTKPVSLEPFTTATDLVVCRTAIHSNFSYLQIVEIDIRT
jgi:hypothetical protein